MLPFFLALHCDYQLHAKSDDDDNKQIRMQYLKTKFITSEYTDYSARSRTRLGFTLRRVLALLKRSVITSPRVNRFG